MGNDMEETQTPVHTDFPEKIWVSAQEFLDDLPVWRTTPSEEGNWVEYTRTT
jgi:hypothetical protein